MHVLFLTCPSHRYTEPELDMFLSPLPGAFLLSEIIRNHGCSVELIQDADVRLSDLTMSEELERKAKVSDLVCISATSFNWHVLRLLPMRLHTLGHPVPVIVGGVHASLVPDYLISDPSIDVVAPGEGEEVILELVDAYRGKRGLETINGIKFRKNGCVVSTPLRKVLSPTELSNTQVLKWDDLNDAPRFLPVQTSRGCLMNCRFCSVPFRRSWRAFSVKHILSSIEIALEKMGNSSHKSILFADDCLTADKQFVLELVEGILESHPEVWFTIEGRITDLLDIEILSALVKLNIQTIQVGVECGYDEGLKRIRKGLNTNRVWKFAELMNKFGMGHTVRYSYIVGFPWESLEEITRTMNFAYKVAKKWGGVVQLNWWMVMPGNDLFHEIARDYDVDESLFDKSRWFLDKSCFFETHPWITQREVEAVQEYATFLALSHPTIPTIGSVFNTPWLQDEEVCLNPANQLQSAIRKFSNELLEAKDVKLSISKTLS